MADITAANITFVGRFVEGSILHEIYKVKGDGSGVTVPIRLGRGQAHAVGVIDAAAGYNPAIVLTARVATYAVAPLNNVSHFLHVWGTD